MSEVVLLWKDPETNKKYYVSIHFVTVDGINRFVGYKVLSVDDSQITVELTRRIPLIKLEKEAKEKAFPKPKFNATLRGAQRGSTLPDDLLEEVAIIYKDALNYSVSPIKAVAKAFNISKSTAAKRVMLARKQGYLGKATRGKAG